MFEPVARVPQLVARLLAAEYRLELRATDRLLASPVGPTKSSQKSPNTQPDTLSTGGAVFAVILFTKNVTQQLGNRKFRGTFAQLRVHDFVPQLN